MCCLCYDRTGVEMSKKIKLSVEQSELLPRGTPSSDTYEVKKMSHGNEEQGISRSESHVPFLNDESTIDLFKRSRLMMYLPKTPAILESIKQVYPEAKIFPTMTGQTTSPLFEEVKEWVEKVANDSAAMAVLNDPGLTTRGKLKQFGDLSVAYDFIQVHVAETEDNFIPLFYAWFFNLDDSKNLRDQGDQLLDQLSKKEKFVEEFSKFAIDAPTEGKVDILHYFNTKDLLVGETLLHCTAFFSNFLQIKETEGYNRCHLYDIGKAFKMEIIGFLVTPRTFGVRLKLSGEELGLWHDDIKDGDEEKNFEGGCGNDETGWEPSKYSPTKGRGSTSHLTLAVRKNTSAVETGKDLKEIIEREVEDQKTHKERVTVKLEIGDARCYGEGLWAIYLNEPQMFSALFSNFYEPAPQS